MVTTEQIARADRKGRAAQAEYGATGAYFDNHTGRVVVRLHSDMEFTFPPSAVQGLEDAKVSELSDLRLTPSGLGLYFPKLDVDVSIPNLLHGITGTKNWMAAQLGRAGGAVSSPRKATTAQANGKLGGRPPSRPRTTG